MNILITGGAGFIGINSARRFFDKGHKVIIFDNLSRKGARLNLEWLKQQGNFDFVKGDTREFNQLKECFLNNKEIDVVLHLAAQVALTSSVEDPREDFETNALGTFNICESVRRFQPDAILIYASTNKVYGPLNDLEIIEEDGKYKYKTLSQGISEERHLDFHSPYACSKGAGDQYVMDYARIYNLKTVNIRQSCIYGPHQFGIEDQGWVAYFAICAVLDKPITIYGDGKQVRDILYVDDLIACYMKAIDRIDKIRGKVYNIGGGSEEILSPLGLISLIENISGKKIQFRFDRWRPGDQEVFVSDIGKARRDLEWKPSVRAEDGIKRLFKWISGNRNLFGLLS